MTLVYYPRSKELVIYDYSEAGSYLFNKTVSRAREFGVPIEVIGGKVSLPPYLVVKTLAKKYPNLKIRFNDVDLAYWRLLDIIKHELGRKPGDYHVDGRNKAIPVKYLLKLYNDLLGK